MLFCDRLAERAAKGLDKRAGAVRDSGFIGVSVISHSTLGCFLPFRLKLCFGIERASLGNETSYALQSPPFLRPLKRLKQLAASERGAERARQQDGWGRADAPLLSFGEGQAGDEDGGSVQPAQRSN